jgi:hypothetical protein
MQVVCAVGVLATRALGGGGWVRGWLTGWCGCGCGVSVVTESEWFVKRKHVLLTRTKCDEFVHISRTWAAKSCNLHTRTLKLCWNRSSFGARQRCREWGDCAGVRLAVGWRAHLSRHPHAMSWLHQHYLVLRRGICSGTSSRRCSGRVWHADTQQHRKMPS